MTWTLFLDDIRYPADARERYLSGEPANYELKPNQVYEDEDDEVPF